VRKRPLYEVVGQLGMWGTIINGVQASIIEHNGMKKATWSGRNSLLFHFSFWFVRSSRDCQLGFCLGTQLVRIFLVECTTAQPTIIYVTAMFILYTVAPLLYRLASSAYFNLSLLTSDFFGLLFGAHMTADLLLKHT
jgi:solute carrier family 35, member F1/2